MDEYANYLKQYFNAVTVIQKYIDKYLFDPKVNWPEKEFKSRCYSQQVANEILDRITDEASTMPNYISYRDPLTVVEIIEDYIFELEDYYDESITKTSILMFYTMKETAIDIIMLFL